MKLRLALLGAAAAMATVGAITASADTSVTLNSNTSVSAGSQVCASQSTQVQANGSDLVNRDDGACTP